MIQPTVLILDDDETFLKGCTASLESSGYQVFPTRNSDEALQLIGTGLIHVAIIDLFLGEDIAREDPEGLTVARQIPSEIGVVFQSAYMTRVLMEGINSEFVSRDLHCEYIFKLDKDASIKLIGAVERLLGKYIRINFSLDWISSTENNVTLIEIAQHLSGDTSARVVMGFSVELESLFRKLFFDYDAIRLSKLLYWQLGEIAVVVQAQTEHRVLTHTVVVTTIAIEITNGDKPKPSPERAFGITRSHVTRTMRFECWIAEYDGEVETLVPLYSTIDLSNKRFRNSLSHLLKSQLSSYQKRMVFGPSTEQPFTTMCASDPFWQGSDQFVERMRVQIDLISESAKNFGRRIEQSQDEIIFEIGEVRHTLRNPASIIEGAFEILDRQEATLSPGMALLPRSFVDSEDRLLVFGSGKPQWVPMGWDHAGIEVSLRFEAARLTESPHKEFVRNPGEQYLLEQHLSWQENRQQTRLPSLPKLQALWVEVVETHRKIVKELHIEDNAYWACLLVQTTQHWLRVNPRLLAFTDASWLVFKLLSSTFVAEGLEAIQTAQRLESVEIYDEPTFRILNPNRCQIVVCGVEQFLTPQDFRLFAFLLSRINQVCSRSELISVLNKDGDSRPHKDIQLEVPIARLRGAIEPKPKEPRYLITERGSGYMLVGKLDP